MAEHGVPQVIDILTEVVTGDKRNTKQLYDMMQKGEVSVDKYMIPFLEAVRREAAPGLSKYHGSLMESSNKFPTRADNLVRALLGNDKVIEALKSFNNNVSQWLVVGANNVEKLGWLFSKLAGGAELLVDGIGKAISLIHTSFSNLTEGSQLWKSIANTWDSFFGDSAKTSESLRDLGIAVEEASKAFTTIGSILTDKIMSGLGLLGEGFTREITDPFFNHLRTIGFGEVSDFFQGRSSISLGEAAMDTTIKASAKARSQRVRGNINAAASIDRAVDALRQNYRRVQDEAIARENRDALHAGRAPEIDTINRYTDETLRRLVRDIAPDLSESEVENLRLDRFELLNTQDDAERINNNLEDQLNTLNDIGISTGMMVPLLTEANKIAREILVRDAEKKRTEQIGHMLTTGSLPFWDDIDVSSSLLSGNGIFTGNNIPSLDRLINGGWNDFRGIDPGFDPAAIPERKPLSVDINVKGSINVEGDVTTSSIDMGGQIVEKVREEMVSQWGLAATQTFGRAF